METTWRWLLKVSVLFVALLVVGGSAQSDPCGEYTSCGECVSGPQCEWVTVQDSSYCTNGTLVGDEVSGVDSAFECPELQCWERYIVLSPYVCDDTAKIIAMYTSWVCLLVVCSISLSLWLKPKRAPLPPPEPIYQSEGSYCSDCGMLQHRGQGCRIPDCEGADTRGKKRWENIRCGMCKSRLFGMYCIVLSCWVAVLGVSVLGVATPSTTPTYLSFISSGLAIGIALLGLVFMKLNWPPGARSDYQNIGDSTIPLAASVVSSILDEDEEILWFERSTTRDTALFSPSGIALTMHAAIITTSIFLACLLLSLWPMNGFNGTLEVLGVSIPSFVAVAILIEPVIAVNLVFGFIYVVTSERLIVVRTGLFRELSITALPHARVPLRLVLRGVASDDVVPSIDEFEHAELDVAAEYFEEEIERCDDEMLFEFVRDATGLAKALEALGYRFDKVTFTIPRERSFGTSKPTLPPLAVLIAASILFGIATAAVMTVMEFFLGTSVLGGLLAFVTLLPPSIAGSLAYILLMLVVMKLSRNELRLDVIRNDVEGGRTNPASQEMTPQFYTPGVTPGD